MKNKLFTGFLLSASLMQTGCLTANLWSDGHTKTTYRYVPTGNDRILAFGQAKQDSSQIKKDSLVLMGKKYWYVLSKTHGEQLFLPILRANLSKPFSIYPDNKFENLNTGVLPIMARSDGKTFFSKFCLGYETENKTEVTTLSQMKFNQIKPQSTFYRRCFNAEGDIFATNQSMPTEYQFESDVPVTLFKVKKKTDVKVGAVVAKSILTPVTLAVDAVTSVVTVPFYVILAKGMSHK